jgi:outer membrane lipoprotein carrier protein
MTGALAFLALAAAGHAASPKAPEHPLPAYEASTAPITVPLVLERFAAFDRDMKSMTCRFEQTVRWQESGVAQRVEGFLQFKKPELLRIEQKAPEPQTLVADGSWLWIHRLATQQVIQTKLSDWKKSEPLAQGLMDLGNYAELLKRYSVSVSTVSPADALGYRRFELSLKPKEKRKAEEFELIMKLSTRDFFPHETELRAGQVVVRSSFKDLRFNPALSDELFKFTPPPDVDVFKNFKPPRTE